MKLVVLMSMVFYSVSTFGQKFTETVNQEYDNYNVFYLANVSGDIDVEGYSGDKIILEANKMLDGKNEVDIEKLKKEVVITEVIKGDTLIIYIKGLSNCFCSDEERFGWNNEYRYNFNNWDQEFDYNFDFTVKVPENINLNLSTINNGDVDVTNVKGELNVRNVNGAISLMNVSGKTRARTINGDVLIDYSSNPTGNSKYYTLNGDIKANFQKDLNAVLAFKSFNGELFTNINELEYLPIKVEKSEIKNGKGVSYQIGGRTEVKIRNGGLYLDFETFNGDVIVKEI